METALLRALARQGIDLADVHELHVFLTAHAAAWELHATDPPLSLCNVSAAIAFALAEVSRLA